MVPPKRSEALQFDFDEPTPPVPASRLPAPPADPAVQPAPARPSTPSSGGSDQVQNDDDSTRGRSDSTDLVQRVGQIAAAAAASPKTASRLAGESAEAAISVTEFYDRVKRALKGQFPEELWMTGEIRKVSVSKGNRYLELADHQHQGGRSAISATIEVSCWSRDWPHIGARLQSVGIDLAPGLVVRLRGRVGVWEGASRLRFSMTDIDVEALVGGIAAARRKLITALEAEGLLRANRQLPVPLVPLRIGIITAAGSEAHSDFTGQLERSGYAFETKFIPSLMQGNEAPLHIASAIRRAQNFKADLIVIVRGGGAKGDLAAFDSEDVARSIASSRTPIWTGVGHTGDQSVADEVAQRACITPTACGQAVVARVTEYLDATDARARAVSAKGRVAFDRHVAGIEDRKDRLGRAAKHEVDQAVANLALAKGRLRHVAVVATERNEAQLMRCAASLVTTSRHTVAAASDRLAAKRAMLEAYDPRRQLERGWSLTKLADGRIVRSTHDVREGDRIVTVLSSGSLTSMVETLSGDGSRATTAHEED